MDIQRHLTHRVLWKPNQGEDRWGEVSYGNPTSVMARWEEKSRSQLSPGGGAAVTLTNNVYVHEDIRIGDLVALETAEIADPTSSAESDYQEVEARESLEDVRGNTLGYILYLEPVGRS